MTSPFLGEFMGTAVLIFRGDGVVANVVLKKSKAEASGWIVITSGWCFAVMAGIFTALACGSRDAHVNPAFTMGFAVISGNYSKLLPYATAQLLGAFTGAFLVWVFFLPHSRETEDASMKLAVFCTIPAIRKFSANLACEIIGTFLLVFVVAAIFSKAASSAVGFAPGMGPYLVASLIWGVGLCLGGTTGFAVNPARDLGPRIAHAILPIAGKGTSDWGYAIVPVLGPLIGGSLAGLTVRFLGF